MNGFDMIILVVMGYCVIRGIFRGFIREVSAIVGVLGGGYAAYSYYRPLSPLFAAWISDPSYHAIAAFLVLFCAVFLAVMLVGILIRFLVKMALLGVIDRIFGAMIGAVKGVLIVSLIFLFLVSFLPPRAGLIVQQSRLSPLVNAVSKDMVRLVPLETRKRFMNRLDDIKKDRIPIPLSEENV